MFSSSLSTEYFDLVGLNYVGSLPPELGFLGGLPEEDKKNYAYMNKELFCLQVCAVALERAIGSFNIIRLD